LEANNDNEFIAQELTETSNKVPGVVDSSTEASNK